MPLKITFTFDSNDWMEFQKHYLKNSKQFKRTKLIIALVFPLIWGLVLILKAINGNFNPIEFSIVVILATLWAVFYPKRLTARAHKKAKKMISEGDNTGVLGQQTIAFDIEGIVQTMIESEQKITWKGIKKMEEIEAYYFLYNTSMSAIIIPKFKIPSELKEVDQMLEKYLNSAK